MKLNFCALVSLLATPLMAHDPTPSCLATPLSGLTGNYTFQIEGIYPHQYGITGTMNASIGTNRAGAAVGLLKITATSFFDPTLTVRGTVSNQPAATADPRDASVTRLETDFGSFQVNPSCTGGTLTFNLSSRPMQFDFWFLDGGRRIFLVSTINGLEATGIAVAGPAGCPAGITDPLQILPVRWAFTARGSAAPQVQAPPPPDDNTPPPTGGPKQPAGPPGPGSIGPRIAATFRAADINDPYAIAGFWNASVGLNRANSPVGLLAITASSNLGYGGSITRLESDAGSFQANADCSGGTLTLNLSSRPVQLDFWYAAGFQKLYFVATNGMPVLGEASR
jgi:hypothetical protein